MNLRTNAKTNLWLRVLGRRPDGYHEIETIFHTLGLADSITIGPASSGEIEVDMRSEAEPMAGLPVATDNLVHSAASKLMEAGGRAEGVRIEIVKRIPIGAGLGGGSGNAAAVLDCLNEMWDLGFDTETLAELALDLGADVPYCLSGGTALATGRGEAITPLPAPATLWFVLGLSAEPLLTRAVYGAFESDRAAPVNSAPMAQALGLGDVDAIAALLHNDLEPPAFSLRPELAELKAAMLGGGALGAVMSGSGPTMIGLARDQGHASAVALAVEQWFDRVTVTSSRPECIERLD